MLQPKDLSLSCFFLYREASREEEIYHIPPFPLFPVFGFYLERDLRCGSAREGILILGESLLNLAGAVVLDNLGAVANEESGVDEAVDIVPDGLWTDACVSLHVSSPLSRAKARLLQSCS